MRIREARIQRECSRYLHLTVAVLLASVTLAITACGKSKPEGSGGGGGSSGGFGGAGPWPIENRQYGASDGIAESPVIGASTDEAQNLWVATHAALYLLKPGEARFHRYTATDGLHLKDNPVRYCDDWAPNHECPIFGAAADPGITEIVGGSNGEVFVGYAGTMNGDGSWTDRDRHSGGLDRVRLNADGSLAVTRLQMVAGVSAEFWHDRTVERLVYDHFQHPHELYVGTNHGVDLMRPDKYRDPKPDEWFNDVNKEWMADHLHPRVCYHRACTDDSNQRLGDFRGLALSPDGDVWVAGRWTAGKIRWTSSLTDWFSRSGSQSFPAAFGDPYPVAPNADGFINEPVFRPPLEGDPVSLSAVAVAKDGRVWFASGAGYGDPAYGVAFWDGRKFTVLNPTSELGMAEPAVQDLVALPDGRMVLAGASTGLVVYDPASGSHTPLRGTQWLPSDHVLRLELDQMVNPPALHVATAAGVAVIRKLP